MTSEFGWPVVLETEQVLLLDFGGKLRLEVYVPPLGGSCDLTPHEARQIHRVMTQWLDGLRPHHGELLQLLPITLLGAGEDLRIRDTPIDDSEQGRSFWSCGFDREAVGKIRDALGAWLATDPQLPPMRLVALRGGGGSPQVDPA